MIQIRRLRTFLDKNGQPVTHTPLFEPDLYAETHEALFEQKLWEKIPMDERYNCFFTVSESKIEQTKREQVFQSALFFDIDGIHTARVTEYLGPIEKALLVKHEDILVINSGHGLHLLLQAGLTLSTPKDYKELKAAYDLVCERIDTALRLLDLPGKCDRQVFSPNRMVRLPFTTNHKENKEEVAVEIISEGFKELTFDLKKLAFGDAEIPLAAQVSPKEFKRKKLDALSIEQECGFLRYAKENGSKLSEPEWYGALSFLARLPNGAEKCHEYSKAHVGYSAHNTDTKIKQAIEAAGPRTCENISTLFPGCKECPHFGKVKTPLHIKSEDFIASEDDGFYTYTEKGLPIPQYEDLRKFFERKHAYRVHRSSSQVYIFNGTHYVEYELNELREFAAIHFKPTPKEYIAQEFIKWVTRTKLIGEAWFKETLGFINFKNGVLEIASSKLLPHSPQYGFLYCLPFNYTAEAECPTFDRFMSEVTLKDKDLQTLILEYIGYSLCDRSYWLQRALVFIGGGSNGKSTLLQTIQMLAGDGNFSTLSMNDFQDPNARSQLEGKLLNICDELPVSTVKNTEMFKKLTGGSVTIRRLYKDPRVITNSAKFFFSCNQLPKSQDVSDGYFRRLTIIPFRAKFVLEEGTADDQILIKLASELPGIFNRVFAAYKELKKRKRLIDSLNAKREIEAYKSEINWIEEWFRDTYTLQPISKAIYQSTRTIYSDYQTLCDQTGEKTMSQKALFAHIRRFLGDFHERYGRLRLGNERLYVLFGLVRQKMDAVAENPSL